MTNRKSFNKVRGFNSDDDANFPDFLIHPANSFKMHWDILMTGLLLFSCIATPV